MIFTDLVTFLVWRATQTPPSHCFHSPIWHTPTALRLQCAWLCVSECLVATTQTVLTSFDGLRDPHYLNPTLLPTLHFSINTRDARNAFHRFSWDIFRCAVRAQPNIHPQYSNDERQVLEYS